MDRFIVDRAQLQSIVPLNLKSNMDRFIGSTIDLAIQKNGYLKSNMDRFIVEPFCQTFALNVFKIQYG